MKENLKVRSIIEIVGSPENYVNELLDKVISKIGERNELRLNGKEIFKAEQIKDKPLWSGFCDVEMDVENLGALMSFCLDFLPSSVEIIEPDTFYLPNSKLNNVFNDLLAKLHENNLNLRNTQAQNILLRRELGKLKGGEEEKKQ